MGQQISEKIIRYKYSISLIHYISYPIIYSKCIYLLCMNSNTYSDLFCSSCQPLKGNLEYMEDTGRTSDKIAMKVQFLSPLKSPASSLSRRSSSVCSSGLRYRNLGKSGLRVSNIGFG